MAKLLQLFIFLTTIFNSHSLISAIESHSSSFSSSPSSSPTFPFSTSEFVTTPEFLSPLSSITHILDELGFHDFAMASRSLSLSSESHLQWIDRPVTVFAPSDSSMRTCPSCSLPLLLQEHSIPGLYPLDYLSNIIFGAKIETIFPGRCLTVTSSVNGTKIFVNGAEITHPDLYVGSRIIIHGVQGFLSHLSPFSCSTEKLTSLALPHLSSPSTAFTRIMLIDTMIRLRTSGYSILSLAIKIKFHELVTLHNMTIFAVDDFSIFHGGHAYVHSVRFHIIPNRHLKISDLEKLPVSTVFPTLESGESLTITNTPEGNYLSPMRINYIKIKYPNLLYNSKVIIHGIPCPFPHLSQSIPVTDQKKSGFYPITTSEFGSDARESTVSNVRQSSDAPMKSNDILEWY
ncbi:fasciclin-like arabinogalactan protein 21 [Amaranthus tricolor]|uniref:fasciclin-like arabinogalactan protein 21 n=1 Tax=Amaranthus tricolor TaxID=29722 RepID=UPI00258F60AC|nr:fasciclin-like arabinogalactan protein 21 [Amaranthus tricolor]